MRMCMLDLLWTEHHILVKQDLLDVFECPIDMVFETGHLYTNHKLI